MIQFDFALERGYGSFVLRSYRYRLSPTRAQERTLFAWLRMTREIYNASLQERRDAWRKQRVRVSAFDQMHALASVREVRPEFAAVPVVVLRGAIRRLDKAFAGFFRRCKAGATPGYPRFRGRHRWNSLLIDDMSGRVPIVGGGKRVAVPLLGKVKFRQHRPIEGTPKAMRLTFACGRWFVTFACADVPKKPLPPSDAEVGIDLGLTHFVATSDGDFVDVPMAEREANRALARAHRRVSRRKRGGGRRRAAVRLLARAHERVANVRRERHIVLARALVAAYGRIFVEKLNIKGLARSMLAGPIHRAAWGGFLGWLRIKAEEAEREVVEVDPRGTSQTCSGCGIVGEHKTLAERTHRCADCGLVLDRDVNAARNVLGLGRSLRGAAPLAKGRRRSVKIKSVATDRSTPLVAAGAS